ncbi:hypothetical protein DMN91_011176 [Ooceraea biroi]|uniref:Uncharacterized protein n=1 Tax=Ooceraea biroi TaxID=2015173 RepID=A0A3L8D9E7_OOCBI|nr:ankyrin repeat domain-containing protein 39 [Ooceraea biroi]XP_026829460.1 ankyrin repeat domain-containing protein 39 [Ooceraea biroi]RLU17107.1 hypothetical protein DMN91_011176 [Ooceraea biroi]
MDQHQCNNDETNECCEATRDYGIRQTLEEMDFERGIWAAAKDGDLERVQELLDRNVSPNVEDSAGYKPLHYAARNGHYDVCELLLDNGADINAVTPAVGATALHRAATQGHSNIVKMLLRHGANVNLVDADGRTALHRVLSAPLPRDQVFEQLIPVTDLRIRDKAGRTVEDLAILNCDENAQHLIKMKKKKIQGKNR